MSPYVTNKMKPTRGRYGAGENPISGANFLARWKHENGLN